MLKCLSTCAFINLQPFKEGKLEEAEAAQDSIASFRAVFKYGNPNTVVKKRLQCSDILLAIADVHSTICAMRAWKRLQRY